MRVLTKQEEGDHGKHVENDEEISRLRYERFLVKVSLRQKLVREEHTRIGKRAAVVLMRSVYS